MKDKLQSRESTERIYTHRLSSGSEVFRSDPSVNEADYPPYPTTTPWDLSIRGGDREGRRYVRARITAIINQESDGDFYHNAQVYINQRDLVRRTTEKRILTEIAVADTLAAGKSQGEIYTQPGLGLNLGYSEVGDNFFPRGKKSRSK
ncbi:hypothetical protein BH09PAT1_BH09PAT1_5060 [soil metagenome]